MLFVVCATAVAVAKPGGEVLTQTPDQGSPGLEKVGPINPDTGFPDWYRDRKGKTLEPCLDPKDPMCVLGAIDDPNKPISMTPPPGSPAGTKPNFPDEFFYQSASAGLSNVGQPDDAGKAGKMTAVMSLEGAFANGAPKQGDQMVFGRIRMKVTSGLVSGETYKVVYPYGEQDIQVDAAEHGFFVTEDMGLTPGSFSDALNGRVAPFLHWTADSALPAGYTGIPGTDHTIMGGVNDQNYVMLIGKDAAFTAPAAGSSAVVGGVVTPADSTQCPDDVRPDGVAAVDCLYTSLFSLAGKESTRGGLDVTSATYTRDAAGATTFDVRADSKATTPSQNVIVQQIGPPATGPDFPITNLVDRNGHFYAHVNAANLAASGAEPKVRISNYSDSPRTVRDVQLVDTLTGTAVFTPPANPSAGPGSIVVSATSSDAKLSGTMHTDLADDAGNLVDLGGGGAVQSTPAGGLPLTAPPATVKVTSPAGGTVVLPVTMTGANYTPPANLHADAGRDLPDIDPDQTGVALSGTGSSGTITGYQWTGPYAVTKDANGVFTFGGLMDPTTSTASLGSFNGTETNETATITAPHTAGDYGYRLVVTGTAGPDTNKTAPDEMVLTVGAAGVDEILTPGKQRYTAAQKRWVISGTSSDTTKNVITVFLGDSVAAGSPILGTATVDPTGTWALDIPDSDIVPAANQTVSLLSSNGKSATGLLVDVRAAGGAGGGGGGAAPAAAAAGAPTPVAPVLPAAAGAARPIAGAIPGAGVVALARIAAPATVRATALATNGVAVNVTVPANATLLRVRVLTTANKALLTTFKKVKGGKKVKVTLRSAKAARKLGAGKRFVVEVRAGTAKNRLGKATRKVIRVRA